VFVGTVIVYFPLETTLLLLSGLATLLYGLDKLLTFILGGGK
jgi:hypothetical protein